MLEIIICSYVTGEVLATISEEAVHQYLRYHQYTAVEFSEISNILYVI